MTLQPCPIGITGWRPRVGHLIREGAGTLEGISASRWQGRCRRASRRRSEQFADRDRLIELAATLSSRSMSVVRSSLLFALAALAEIGGAWLVWQGVREHRGVAFIGAGIAALGAYGFVATLQDDPHFGRILAAYGGIFVAGSLAWGVVVDGFRPDRFDLIGAAICLVGVAVIMFTPR